MTTPIPPVLLWLRRELRLADNPAVAQAVASGHPVVPVYVLDETTAGPWAPGGAHRWWLHHSLVSLAADLRRAGAPLVLRRGPAAEVLRQLVAETGAVALHVGQPIEPWARHLIAGLERDLGVPVAQHRTTTLFEPEAITTKAGTPYGVFTPFAAACRARGRPPAPLPAPARIAGPANAPRSDTLESWHLLPTRPDWAGGFRAFWTDGPGGAPGEAAAHARLDAFTRRLMEGYADTRNSPGIDGTSLLSARLHWGELSAGQVWHMAEAAQARMGQAGEAGTGAWISELLWREFSAHLLWHHPDLPEMPLRREFLTMAWQPDKAMLQAWQHGRTGVPIVDAGMRQMWRLGWMHNRVRMIVASYLVKHLLQPWQDGEAWFWDTLVDGDLASNSAQWQWVAGCGADAAPFFRIFNPVLQGRKFDPAGAYVRTYVPELARLPDAHLHAPWAAPEPILTAAGVRLGTTYPAPLVDLGKGRERALAAFRALRSAA